MTENGSGPLADLFEEGLSRLETGMSVDEMIAYAPEFSDELRSLLETARAARNFQPEDPPHAVLQRGRTRLLVQAERLRRENSPRRAGWNWPRLALQLMAVLLVAVISLTSLVAASAQSLPGDRLYGVKLAAEEVRLSTSGEGVRPVLEDALRALRIDEVRDLLRLRRPAAVVFEGVVTAITDTVWDIAGLRIAVGRETAFNGDIRPGMFVEVRGHTTDDGRLIADTIYLRAYAFAGALLARNGAIWQVDAVPVLITPETQLAPNIDLGDQVIVLAQVDDQGTISARAILLGQQTLIEPEDLLPGFTPAAGTPAAATPQPEPEPTQTGGELQTPEPDPEPDPEGTEDEAETETEDPEDDSDNSGSGSGSSGSGSEGTETEEPDDD